MSKEEIFEMPKGWFDIPEARKHAAERRERLDAAKEKLERHRAQSPYSGMTKPMERALRDANQEALLANGRLANLLDLNSGSFQHMGGNRVTSGSGEVHLCPECENRLVRAAIEQAVNSINVRHLNRTGLLEHAFIYRKAFFKRVQALFNRVVHSTGSFFSRGPIAPSESVNGTADSSNVKSTQEEAR